MLWNVQQDIKHSTQCLEEIFTWQQNSGADGAFSADDEKAQWRKPSWFPTTQIHLTGDSKRLFWFPTHKEMQQTNKQIQQTNKQKQMSLSRNYSHVFVWKASDVVHPLFCRNQNPILGLFPLQGAQQGARILSMARMIHLHTSPVSRLCLLFCLVSDQSTFVYMALPVH